jgi:uncharacterized protein (TIGR02284 family)
MKKSKLIIAHLNELLIVNFQAEKIFLQALDQIENSVLKNFFRVSGYERNQMIKHLDSNIRQKGGTPVYPEDSSSLNAQFGSNLSQIISSKDEQLLFTEIGRMKLLDIQKYQNVLNDFDFPGSIEKLLIHQKDTIVKSLYSIEVHKDLFAKKIVSLD